MRTTKYSAWIFVTVVLGLLAWQVWHQQAEDKVGTLSISNIAQAQDRSSPMLDSAVRIAGKAAPKPEPLPDILPKGGIQCPWTIYAEFDQPELAVQESLRAVLKYVLGRELPKSASDFGLDRGFKMNLEDASELIKSLKELEEDGRERWRATSPFIWSISTFIGEKSVLWSGPRQKYFDPGYTDCTIFLTPETVLFRGWKRSFKMDDRYQIRIDAKTGWGTFDFIPGAVPD